jgi:hypothetical protein
MLELALVHNGAARFIAMIAPAANPANSSPAASGQTAPPTTEVRQPVMTDDSPTARSGCFGRGPRHSSPGCCRSRSRASFSPGRMHGAGRAVSRRISAGVWTGWLVMYWIVLSFAGD